MYSMLLLLLLLFNTDYHTWVLWSYDLLQCHLTTLNVVFVILPIYIQLISSVWHTCKIKMGSTNVQYKNSVHLQWLSWWPMCLHEEGNLWSKHRGIPIAISSLGGQVEYLWNNGRNGMLRNVTYICYVMEYLILLYYGPSEYWS